MDQLISECERSQVWYLSKQGNFTGSEDLGLQIRNRTLNEWILIGGNKEEGLQDLQAEKKPPPPHFIYLFKSNRWVLSDSTFKISMI